MTARKTLNPFPVEEQREWRAARRAAEEQRALREQRWRDNPAAAQGERATEVRKAGWLAAMRWRRQVQTVCRRFGLTFTQWLILHSVQQLIDETKDAVIQAQIAARVELDQATVSEVTRRLDEKGLVSRGVDVTEKAWRVLLTEKAEHLLREIEGRIECISATTPAGSECGTRCDAEG